MISPLDFWFSSSTFPFLFPPLPSLALSSRIPFPIGSYKPYQLIGQGFQDIVYLSMAAQQAAMMPPALLPPTVGVA